MCNFIKNSLDLVRKFTAVDFGVLKIYLISIGVLLGVYFSAFFVKYISVVWIIAAITFIIILVRLARYSCCRCKKKEKSH